MNRNWRRVLRIGLRWSQIQIEQISQIYFWSFLGIVLGVAIAIPLGVFFNQVGVKGGNFVLAAIFLVGWAFLTFHPAVIAIAFGLGTPDGLPKDWSLNKLIREAVLPDLKLSEVVKEGLEFVRKVVRWSKHLALFVTTIFVVFGSWNIENPSVVLPVFVVLAGIGLLSSLFQTKTIWYKRTVTAILFVSLTSLLYTGYHYLHPQDETVDEVEAAIRRNDDNKVNRALQAVLQKIDAGQELTKEEEETLKKARQERRARSLKGAVSDFFYSKTIPIEVMDLRGQKVCGIKPGTRKFSVPKEIYARIGGQNTELSGYILFNEVPAGQKFVAEDAGNGDGCANMSFAFTTEWKQMTVEPQIIFVTIG